MFFKKELSQTGIETSGTEKRKVFSVFFLLFLCLTAFGEVYKVCHECPLNSVALALETAQAGDTLLLKAGIYKETRLMLVDKPLTLIGESGATLDGSESGSILLVKSKKVFISGLTFQNTGTSYTEDRAGIRIENSSEVTISGNRFWKTAYGIYLSNCVNIKIFGNSISGEHTSESSSGNGIHIWKSDTILVEENRIDTHRDGIYLEFVKASVMNRNFCSKMIRYGLHFMFSHNNTFEDNTFQENGAGVAVMYSKEINMRRNRFADNWSPVSYGLLLKDIFDSNLEQNVFKGNTVGIYAEGSNRNVFLNNNFEKNGWAIKIMGNCEDNKIERNNFFSNTFEVVTNSPRNRNFFSGNYWSDYTGYDLDRDGIGDVPHRPVRLFTYLVERIPETILLLRSMFIDLLELAEKITPVITPAELSDEKPSIKPIPW